MAEEKKRPIVVEYMLHQHESFLLSGRRIFLDAGTWMEPLVVRPKDGKSWGYGIFESFYLKDMSNSQYPIFGKGNKFTEHSCIDGYGELQKRIFIHLWMIENV